MRVDVELLGAFTVRLDGRTMADWEHRRSADLVALLALAPGHRMVRDEVVDALWPELAPDAGAANLHKAAHHARRALDEPSAVVLRSGVVALFPGAEIHTDVERFMEAARRGLAIGDPTLCAAAADLLTGELLPERRYERWTDAHRERLRRLELDLLRAAGRWRDVVAREPSDEAAHRAVMRAYIQSGQRHAAVRQFQRLRDLLATELGVRPAAATVSLYREAVSGLAASPGPGGPLVGRDVALARLHAALRSVDQRGAGPLVVTGEAGIGKTRLCGAFCDQAGGAGWAVLRTAAGADAVPYDTVRRAAHSADQAIVDTLAADVRATLTGGAERSRRQQMLAAFQDLCERLAGQRGCLLFVDDAHLADDDSVALLDLLARAPSTRTVVLLAMRSDATGKGVTALRSRRSMVEVELPALQREESDRLVAALCPRRPAPDELDRIWQLGAGNPFFTTELAAALARGGAVQIPLTLAAAVAARLSGVDRDVVDALRRVAVAGAPGGVDVDEFVALTGLVDDAAFTALDQALAAGVLVVDGDAYRFRHALVARTLAEGVPPHRRQEVHRAAAQRLVAQGGPAARIARHLDSGGRPREGVRWHLEAALASGAVGAYADALGHIETALLTEPGREDLLSLRADYCFASGDPTAPLAYAQAAAAATGIRRDELRLRQAWALLMAGDLPGSMAAMQGIVAGDTTRLRLTLITGLIDWFTGRLGEAERAAGETMRLALASGDTTEVLDSALLHALVAHSRGRWAEQLQLDLLDPRFTGVLAGMLSDAHLCVGELYLYGDATCAEIIDFAGRLRGVAAGAGAVRGVAFATTLLGEAQLLAGDLDFAEENLLEGARAHRALGARGGEAIALHALAELALRQRRHPAVAPLLDEALRAARLSPLSARHLLTRIYGTRIRAAADDATALSVLDEAQANLVRPAEACPLCWVPFLIPAADLLTRTGSPDAAEPLLVSAEELIDILWSGGGRWAPALAAGKAAVARARGDLERARR